LTVLALDVYRLLVIVIRIAPNIKLVRLSVCWFTGSTVKNRKFDSFGADELNLMRILQTGAIEGYSIDN
jgi:hypothetical protein